ncbi:Fic family protein [Scopulibacillus daqui]|uniref:Fic family protein n=1 Tax=Scopulibacillus daqui TaxID=1469162 RepID=A0ABS2PYV3_9BACL|nr:Fic family protein [Scopulibacillus daqui]MBM7645146.1 Fic family protein [Scopulibacillus daqui]
MNFDYIDQLKQKLDDKRPLPPSIVNNLRDVYRIEWTYNSNAIEGNTLTLLETKIVVEEGLTIGGKKLKEHFEAINHAEAIGYVEEIVTNEEDLTQFIIKNIHRLILKNIDDDNAGRYRETNVGISGSHHRPPEHPFIQEKMDELMSCYHTNKTILHPVELASLFHFKFVYIHPFSDGNGRTARLLMNLILMQYGYPPAIIKAKDENRLRYYEALEKASIKGETDDFIQLVSDCVIDSLNHYLSMF